MAYKGSINVSPISRSAMRSGVLLGAGREAPDRIPQTTAIQEVSLNKN
jgi:hypothetical protein